MESDRDLETGNCVPHPVSYRRIVEISRALGTIIWFFDDFLLGNSFVFPNNEAPSGNVDPFMSMASPAQG